MHPLTAHASFAAWREQGHDDLLFALSLCVWWGERRLPKARELPYHV
jgi:hypothetical protein